MTEVAIGFGLLVAFCATVALLGLLCYLAYKHLDFILGPVFVYGGIVLMVVAVSYIIGFDVTHSDKADPHWWAWLSIPTGWLMLVVGTAIREGDFDRL